VLQMKGEVEWRKLTTLVNGNIDLVLKRVGWQMLETVPRLCSILMSNLKSRPPLVESLFLIQNIFGTCTRLHGSLEMLITLLPLDTINRAVENKTLLRLINAVLMESSALCDVKLLSRLQLDTCRRALNVPGETSFGLLNAFLLLNDERIALPLQTAVTVFSRSLHDERLGQLARAGLSLCTTLQRPRFDSTIRPSPSLGYMVERESLENGPSPSVGYMVERESPSLGYLVERESPSIRLIERESSENLSIAPSVNVESKTTEEPLVVVINKENTSSSSPPPKQTCREKRALSPTTIKDSRDDLPCSKRKMPNESAPSVEDMLADFIP